MLSLAAGAVAHAESAVTCNPDDAVATSSDRDLDARACTLQKLTREATNDDERSRCVSALRQIAYQRVKRQVERRAQMRCAEAVAQTEFTITCDRDDAVAKYSDADLHLHHCAISKLHWDADRRMMAAWSPENETESNRCLSALAAIARERLMRAGWTQMRTTCHK